VVAHVGGRTFSQPLVVAGTPGTAYSQADYRARRDLEMRMYAVYDGIDRDLNALDAMRVRAPAAMRARIDALSRRLSANMQNDQDDDFVEDMLRERVQGFLSTLDGAYSRPTAAQYREAGAIEGEYARLSAQFGKVRDAIARL
jgi:hypothetical protein